MTTLFSRAVFTTFFCLFAFLFGALMQERPAGITRETIAHAEQLIGLNFTDAKRDSMRQSLNELRANYDSLREVPLPNSVAPALYFNPVPVNFKFDKASQPMALSAQPSVDLPTNRDDLAFYSVRELAMLIRTKKISSMELTRFFLERLKKYDAKLLCVVSLTEARALEQAARADRELAAGTYRGILHGIPYGLKDLFAVKGTKTTWGSVPYKDQTIDEDATVYKKLDAAGAVLVAKFTLGELAQGDVWFGGMTRNPWNLEQGSSGSSAGSASAVSAGLVPFAIGTETLGSIVSPSTRCGVTGLRPTFGRVSRHGAMALSWSMDKIGPICRTVEDCAIIFDAIRGSDGLDKTVVDAPFSYDGNAPLKQFKVGYLKSAFEQSSPTKSFDSLALVKLRALGAELIPIDLPTLPIQAMRIILVAEAAAAFDDLTRSGRDSLMVRQHRGAWPNTFRQSRFIPAVEYLQANRVRTRLIEEMNTVMANVDVFIAPSFVGNQLTLTNLTGHPCVVAPNGFAQNGSPVSISFIGKLYGEAATLAVAKHYQDATDFHKRHPKLP